LPIIAPGERRDKRLMSPACLDRYPLEYHD
jgi:hypothetical protein